MRIDQDQALDIIQKLLSANPQNEGDFDEYKNKVLQNIKNYATLLSMWNGAFNLIAPKSASDLWGRHIIDSAQLWPYLPSTLATIPKTAPPHLVDLGTGAGLPGMVLAMMGWPRVTLVESNQKKCQFLHEVVRRLSLSHVTIVQQRIEKTVSLQADIIVSRALASLKTLLSWAYPHLNPLGRCVFHKGERWQEELTEAQKYWTMNMTSYPSLTDGAGVVLEINQLDYKGKGHATP